MRGLLTRSAAVVVATGLTLLAAAAVAPAAQACSVESSAGPTFTHAYGPGCVGVQARIDKRLGDKLLVSIGKWGPTSDAYGNVGTFVSNEVRANNDGTITAWINVGWSSDRRAVALD